MYDNGMYTFVWTEESRYDSFGQEKTDRVILELKRRPDLEDDYSWGENGYESHTEIYEDRNGLLHTFEVWYSNSVEQGFDYIGPIGDLNARKM